MPLPTATASGHHGRLAGGTGSLGPPRPARRLLEDSNRRLESSAGSWRERRCSCNDWPGRLAAQEDERRRWRGAARRDVQSMAALLMGWRGCCRHCRKAIPSFQAARHRWPLARLATRMLDGAAPTGARPAPAVLDDHGLVSAVRWLRWPSGSAPAALPGGRRGDLAPAPPRRRRRTRRGRGGRRGAPAGDGAALSGSPGGPDECGQARPGDAVPRPPGRTESAVSVTIEDNGAGLPAPRNRRRPNGPARSCPPSPGTWFVNAGSGRPPGRTAPSAPRRCRGHGVRAERPLPATPTR